MKFDDELKTRADFEDYFQKIRDRYPKPKNKRMNNPEISLEINPHQNGFYCMWRGDNDFLKKYSSKLEKKLKNNPNDKEIAGALDRIKARRAHRTSASICYDGTGGIKTGLLHEYGHWRNGGKPSQYFPVVPEEFLGKHLEKTTPFNVRRLNAHEAFYDHRTLREEKRANKFINEYLKKVEKVPRKTRKQVLKDFYGRYTKGYENARNQAVKNILNLQTDLKYFKNLDKAIKMYKSKEWLCKAKDISQPIDWDARDRKWFAEKYLGGVE